MIAVILAGGLGTRISNETTKKPKQQKPQKNIGKHTQVTLKLKEDMIPWVTNNLVSDGVKIFSIEPHKNSLEDVFLEETGSDD